MGSNRRRWAVLGVVAVAAAASPARTEGADAPPIDVVARGLEAPDPAARARAAETLGTRYPEAAVAVPVLLDATRDEDAAVRAAAVRALRLLGRRGQEDAAKAWTTMGPAALAFHDDVFKVVVALGAAVTPTDLATAFAEASGGGAEVIRAALFGLAIAEITPPGGDFAVAAAMRDRQAHLAVAWPWIRSSDPATARAAAAVLAVLGRAAVASIDHEAPSDDATAASPALVPLLSSKLAVVRFAAWRLIALGAPHAPATGPAVLAAVESLPEPPGGGGPDLDFSGPLRIHRYVGRIAARALGAVARSTVLPTLGGSRPADGARLAALLQIDARDEARAAWAGFLRAWREGRRDASPDLSVVFVAGRDAGLASDAVAALPGLLDAERRFAPRARELLALVDPAAPADRVPADRVPADLSAADGWDGRRSASPCVALAWLAHRVPAELVGEGLRVRTAAALRRALVQPDRFADRALAAAVIADLGRRGLVPAATLVASLRAEGTRADAALTTLVLQALAASGDVPPDVADIAAPLARAPTPPAYAPSLRDRARYAAGWPYVLAALEMKALGAAFEQPALRRLAAIDALGAVVGDKTKAKEVLVPLAKDADARVRYRAANALRRLGA